MDAVRLSFATIKPIANNISEIIVDEGIEITDAMVDELHAYLAKAHPGRFGVLVNKLNSYTYSFGAQQRIWLVDGLTTIAVVVYKHSAELGTRSLFASRRNGDLIHDVFYDYDIALNWLKLQLTSD